MQVINTTFKPGPSSRAQLCDHAPQPTTKCGYHGYSTEPPQCSLAARWLMFNGAQRILGYVRPRRISAVCPHRTGKRRTDSEEPSNWDRPCCHDAVTQLLSLLVAVVLPIFLYMYCELSTTALSFRINKVNPSIYLEKLLKVLPSFLFFCQLTTDPHQSHDYSAIQFLPLLLQHVFKVACV